MTVVSEAKRVKEETDGILKTKGELCCEILKKQKKISALQVESNTLTQVYPSSWNISHILFLTLSFYAKLI